jgi:hypothetical protein
MLVVWVVGFGTVIYFRPYSLLLTPYSFRFSDVHPLPCSPFYSTALFLGFVYLLLSNHRWSAVLAIPCRNQGFWFLDCTPA